MDTLLTWGPVTLAGLAIISILIGNARSGLLFALGAMAALSPEATMSLFASMPLWLAILLGAVLLLMALQGVATILFGRQAGNQVTGAVLVGLTYLTFAYLRLGRIGWLLRWLRRH